MSRRCRVLFSYIRPTSFVQDDLALLRERYEVRPFEFDLPAAKNPVVRAAGLARAIAQQRAWLHREGAQADLAFAWFADHHAVQLVRLARRRGIPAVIALGGLDGIALPELGYGVYTSAWRAPLARYALRHADLLVPVNASLIASTERFATWPEPREQGVRAHVPGCTTPSEVVPTGYDPAAWPMGPAERTPTVLTVGQISSDRTLRRKGVDLVFEVARRVPEARFQVVGMGAAQQRAARARYHPPENVELVGPQPRAALARWYGAAAVYLQLSRAEGMPNVICEAMLCGCIPVGSRAFGIPDAIGEAGLLVEAPDPDEAAAAVRQALRASPAAREAAREHIVRTFPRERRRRELFALLDGLMASDGS